MCYLFVIYLLSICYLFVIYLLSIPIYSYLFLSIPIYSYLSIYTDGWFGAFVIFPSIGNNTPNWLIWGIETINQYIYIYGDMVDITIPYIYWMIILLQIKILTIR